MLAAALGRHVGYGPLENLEQRLLDPLAGDVARDRRVLVLAPDLVDLVDVDDPHLAAVDIATGREQEAPEDALDVLADVTGLRERRRIDGGERHVEHACE